MPMVATRSATTVWAWCHEIRLTRCTTRPATCCWPLERLRGAAGSDGVLEAIPATLGTLEQALQVLSASCYRLAGQCASNAPSSGPPRPSDQGATKQRLSRENEAPLMATLHDVGSSIARASRTSRTGREITAPLIARKISRARQAQDMRDRRTSPFRTETFARERFGVDMRDLETWIPGLDRAGDPSPRTRSALRVGPELGNASPPASDPSRVRSWDTSERS